ncbi:IspD/TarI family cytidylyltransferase [Ilumatobacter coccineus]|uniref:2-C-methyl-D-erythritol 4-phosphate cytidylyltransferase n=1 Tax=Ilumatobacter coccineus (strain NBRC 103263 / KCTC 29153 / YM16-304) TaxID=1313172 RepID=A0A6C7E679_ILUCY|nr:IspD/TarI family cytidylyltransferase [Ilumatobacter coccineus]BAN00779.1 2-C-methyl-D-erythritol 4-phosphate cytidylyltransferase [Ilumatobacter coccineus YM16-304]
MPRAKTKVWTIIVGGGSGQRFGRPKQYEKLDDLRVIDHARRTADAASDGVVLVVPADDVAREGGVAGGATRSESVRAGLAALPADVDVVCVHDAARPLASLELFERVIDAVLAGADAAVPGVPLADTIKVIDAAGLAPGDIEGARGVVVDTPDRSTLVAVQTPQAFRADRLQAAHASGGEATDDAALIESVGGRVVVVDGEATNRKITTPDDLDWTRDQLGRRSS